MDNVIKTEIIENFLIEKKLSKSKFCKMCKITPVTLQKIIANKYNFRIGALFRMAKVMIIEFCEIFN